MNPSIFREYDVRGIAGKDLSAEFARELGLAYAKMIKEELPLNEDSPYQVSVGRDCRLSGEEYASALVDGLRAGGIDVITLGVCPTPLTYFSVFHHNFDGGIMVTGSHNPMEYNGFKIGIGKSTIHGSQIQRLREIMEGGPTPSNSQGNLREIEIIPEYIEYVHHHAKKTKPLKVVLDAGNGTAATVAPPLFKALGAEVIELYCTLDGRFPNHHPDPTVPENLKDLIAKVTETKADFGVAFDGDSDRIGLVAENGQILYGDEIMVILSREILKEHPGATVISEVKSSRRLYEDISKNGGNPIMWKTGHSLIKSKMKETKALLAGEMSGHIFFADRFFGFDDAVYAATRIFEILSHTDKTLSQLIEDLPPVVNTPEIRVDCEEEKKFALVEETKARLKETEYQINDIDGVRVDFGDSWGLVRASNTQPVLVLRFEAPTENRLNEVRKIVESALTQGAQAIGHGPLL
ncbi:MAG: phosphomannomutase [Bdellovibrionaceae bacterium]|nr:phosphomannomutase [Pseudobdellovibrionaceae bacterium]